MEASTQISGRADRPSPDAKAFEAVKARVVTRSFGVRLGAFGVDYTSKKVILDQDGREPGQAPDAAVRASRTRKARGKLLEEASYVSWREATGQDATDSQAAQAGRSTHPDPLWRRGLDAYAKARDMLRVGSSRAARASLAVA